VIADQQASLDLAALLGEQPTGHAATSLTGTGSAARTRLYLHLTMADLLGLESGAGHGTVERLGPATIALIKDWVGHSRVTIQPLLDLGRTDAVDAHDPPAWMRELVILPARRCVFPWCTRVARTCDLDHIVAFDDTGPPGQTHPGNLAPPVPTPSPGQDPPPLALGPKPVRRQLPMDLPERPDLPGHRRRHSRNPTELSRTRPPATHRVIGPACVSPATDVPGCTHEESISPGSRVTRA